MANDQNTEIPFGVAESNSYIYNGQQYAKVAVLSSATSTTITQANPLEFAHAECNSYVCVDGSSLNITPAITGQKVYAKVVYIPGYAQDMSAKADLVNGIVPASQLPSYVDDIIEVEKYEDLPNPGESGKIYIITGDNENQHNQYRWSGSQYTLITNQSILQLISDVSALTLTVSNNKTNIETALSTETTNRETADATLQNNIDTLTLTVSNNKTNIETLLNTESTTRETADTTLQSNIDTLSNTVSTNKTNIETALNNEVTDRSNADTTLQGNIDALTLTVSGNKTAIETSLSTESTDRANADTTLQNNIDTLTTTVSNNKSAIETSLSTESTTRETADATLQSNIDTLSATVSTNKTNIETALSTETTDREAADTTLQNSKQDKDTDAVADNIAVFGTNGDTVDSSKSIGDGTLGVVYTVEQVQQAIKTELGIEDENFSIFIGRHSGGTIYPNFDCDLIYFQTNTHGIRRYLSPDSSEWKQFKNSDTDGIFIYNLTEDNPEGVSAQLLLDQLPTEYGIVGLSGNDEKYNNPVSKNFVLKIKTLSDDVVHSFEVGLFYKDIIVATEKAVKDEITTTKTEIVNMIPTNVSQLTNDVPYLSNTCMPFPDELAPYAWPDEPGTTASFCEGFCDLGLAVQGRIYLGEIGNLSDMPFPGNAECMITISEGDIMTLEMFSTTTEVYHWTATYPGTVGDSSLVCPWKGNLTCPVTTIADSPVYTPVKDYDAATKKYVDTEVGKKVDKVDGKGLSTNDYTTEEKTKLAGLSNYDDTTLVASIATAKQEAIASAKETALQIDGSNALNKVLVISEKTTEPVGPKDTQKHKMTITANPVGYGQFSFTYTDADSTTFTTSLSLGSSNDTVVVKSVADSTYAAKATTLAGYGITDAKIDGNIIVLGDDAITPLTDVPIATTTELGGIVVGSRLEVDSDGVLSGLPAGMPIPDSVNTYGTTKQFCDDMIDSTKGNAQVGEMYMGTVHLIDVPLDMERSDWSTSHKQCEVLVKVIGNGILELDLTSTGYRERCWKSMYNNGSMQYGDTTCPWFACLMTTVSGGYDENNPNERVLEKAYRGASQKYVDDAVNGYNRVLVSTDTTGKSKDWLIVTANCTITLPAVAAGSYVKVTTANSAITSVIVVPQSGETIEGDSEGITIETNHSLCEFFGTTSGWIISEVK